MPFKAAVDAHLESLDSEGYEFKVLSYLRYNALGAKKAKSWKKIASALEIPAEEYSKEDFQNGLLSSSRVNPFFICSCNKGYYIAENISDINIAKHYYESRITTMVSNLKFLIDRSNQIYPECNFQMVEEWLDIVKSNLV